MFSETWGEGKMAQRWGFDCPVTALFVKGWPKFQVYSQKRHRITSVRGPQERGKDIDRCDEPLVVGIVQVALGPSGDTTGGGKRLDPSVLVRFSECDCVCEDFKNHFIISHASWSQS